MSLPSWLKFRTWIIIPLCALGFLLWIDCGRIQRVEAISNTDHDDALIDPASPTGYADGKRWLIVPEHNYHSYQWIAETQQMLARKEWRVRRIDSENAPLGRDVHSPSPYRWWLGLLAWCDHSVSGQPSGLSVERAALLADPLLHLLFLITTTLYVARKFGSMAAGLISLGLATLFPLAASYLPGVPDDSGLAGICAVWSVLPLIAASRRSQKTVAGKSAPESSGVVRARRCTLDFFLAGIAGGIGLWISVANQVPILIGIGIGGFLAGWTARGLNPKAVGTAAQPWMVWSLGGAITCLLAYFIEYFPAHMDFRLEVNHPLYGVSWIGLGALLSLIDIKSSPGNVQRPRRHVLMLIAGMVMLAALPVTMALGKTPAFLLVDLLDSRLNNIAGATTAGNLMSWFSRDGFSRPLVATCLPLLIAGPAGWIWFRGKIDAAQRRSVGLALGPVMVACAFAVVRLRWWNLFDATLLVLVAVVTPVFCTGATQNDRWWAGFTGVVFLTGLIPLSGTLDKTAFSRLEVESLIERGLAHWIADHAGPAAVILAPPDRTSSLCFYGGLRGLGTPSWENQEGLAATARIVSADAPEVAQTLLGERSVTHLVLPSWDADLDEFARLSAPHPEDTFLHALHQWSLPPWIRPLAYKLPSIAGFEGQSVAVLEVTDENNRTTSLSRLAEYFLEMESRDSAAATMQSLQRYPSDLGALVAIAQVQKATGDPTFAATFQTILSSLTGGFDRALAWDRRVSLAVLLAQNGRTDLAREQVKRCLEKIDEAQLRSLSTGSLFRLQVLTRTFELPISDPALRGLAAKLLPPELRHRL